MRVGHDQLNFVHAVPVFARDKARTLTIVVDFKPGTRWGVPGGSQGSIRSMTPLEGLCAWAQTRTTNGFLEALNGLFQAAKRKARGYGRFSTIRTVIFLIASKLDFSNINPYVASQPT